MCPYRYFINRCADDLSGTIPAGTLTVNGRRASRTRTSTSCHPCTRELDVKPQIPGFLPRPLTIQALRLAVQNHEELVELQSRRVMLASIKNIGWFDGE
ncbi:predicted protein [Sclerotinia sclerotiorum 1980 UF-70]|uniref:Uncharacterized protein n=1 Tax=Sclerotinia sclerotiorum (strain ATCC 18683 / 1980 / Ss-1) TaxID=665079 RepID=A7EQD9_SCLS1|nr:predicted protein [Sclerotinia sclerotiorum 1980 UF-70]EDN91681.1 predicted protein [Sclerotinia sclerotiorum 1980 UF-70]